MPSMQTLDVQLSCHPATMTTAVDGIAVRVVRSDRLGLWLRYLVTGHVASIHIPAPCTVRRAEGLWRRTCFEAFLRTPGNPRYWELNLSPSGEWALWRFEGYRAGVTSPPVPSPPVIEVRQTPDALELEANVEVPTLDLDPCKAAIRLGLAVVVEEAGGRCSYWALAHPVDRPDFHHPDSLTLELP